MSRPMLLHILHVLPSPQAGMPRKTAKVDKLAVRSTCESGLPKYARQPLFMFERFGDPSAVPAESPHLNSDFGKGKASITQRLAVRPSDAPALVVYGGRASLRQAPKVAVLHRVELGAVAILKGRPRWSSKEAPARKPETTCASDDGAGG